MSLYSEPDLLLLSGIQHMAFCERQWALIHIEQQWSENVLTIEGKHLHEKVDDPFEGERRGDTIIARAIPLVSYRLGLRGQADVVEFVKNREGEVGVAIEGREGFWSLYPVEYKRGKPKPDERDEVQLCAQAFALEEMYQIEIPKGYLFYGETRHRHEVLFDKILRERVVELAHRMHFLFETATTPKPVYFSGCKSCSLIDICLPRMKTTGTSVRDYLDKSMEI